MVSDNTLAGVRRVYTIAGTLAGQHDGLRGRREEARAAAVDAQRRRDGILNRYFPGRALQEVEKLDKAVAAQVERIEQERVAASAAAARIEASMAEISAISGVYGEIAEAVRDAAGYSIEILAPIDLPPLRLLRDSDPERKRLGELRDEIAGVELEIDAIRDAPLPPAEAAASVMRAIESEQHVARVQLAYFATPSGGRVPAASLGFQAVLFGVAEVETRLRKYFESQPAPGLPGTKRAGAIAPLEKRRIELLKNEERETSALELRGCAVLRRRYIDARLLLEVWDGLKP